MSDGTRGLAVVMVAAGFAWAGCGDDGGAAPADAADTTTSQDGVDTGDVTVAPDSDDGDVTVERDPCDPLDPSYCALPWPSSRFLEPDESRATGYTLAFGEALPRNTADVPIDAEEWRRMDGFGVGDPLMVRFPNIDLTGMATEYALEPSLDDDAPILWFAVGDDDSLTRVPYFVDVDVAETDPSERVLIVRPGVILDEGTRYIVAFRDLQDTDGAAIAPSAAFAALVAGDTDGDPDLGPRQARFDEIFALLEGEAGVDKGDLTLAWDFVTASSDALHGKMLHMRDDALDAFPDGGEIIDMEITENTPDDHDHWWLQITGTFRVPNYMRPVDIGFAGDVYHFNYGEDGLPERDGTDEATFWVRVPHSARESVSHGLIQYGHGQNGRGNQVNGGFNGQIANDHHFIFFACDMWGMAEGDVGGILAMLSDMSGFPRLADRLHQGMVNHLILARTMRERFDGHDDIAPLSLEIDDSRLYYSGISQGGIYGATYVAISPDITRGHLGVPGNQYAFLLFRSRNFEPFFEILQAHYVDRVSQLVTIQAIQQLWNNADPVAYLPRIHDPLPGSPESSILLAAAKGDVQVAVTANENVVRSDIGVALLEGYDDEREVPLVTPVPYPHQGSGYVLYDYGNPWPNGSENRPPTSELDDPHGKPRREVHHNEQMVHFFETGEITDVCGDGELSGCTPQ